MKVSLVQLSIIILVGLRSSSSIRSSIRSSCIRCYDGTTFYFKYSKNRRRRLHNTISLIRCGDNDGGESISSTSDINDNNITETKKRERRKSSKLSFISHVLPTTGKQDGKTHDKDNRPKKQKQKLSKSSSNSRGGDSTLSTAVESASEKTTNTTSKIKKQKLNNDSDEMMVDEDDEEENGNAEEGYDDDESSVVVVVDNENTIIDVEFIDVDENTSVDKNNTKHSNTTDADDARELQNQNQEETFNATYVLKEEDDGDEEEDVIDDDSDEDINEENSEVKMSVSNNDKATIVPKSTPSLNQTKKDKEEKKIVESDFATDTVASLVNDDDDNNSLKDSKKNKEMPLLESSPSSNSTKANPEEKKQQTNITTASKIKEKSAKISSVDEDSKVMKKNNDVRVLHSSNDEYVSSGYWEMIDKITSFGLSSTNDKLRLSRQLRPLRKATARITGLHGVLSGKPSVSTKSSKQQLLRIAGTTVEAEKQKLDDKELSLIQRQMIALKRARKLLVPTNEKVNGTNRFGGNIQRWKHVLQRQYHTIFSSSNASSLELLSADFDEQQRLIEMTRIQEEEEKRIQEEARRDKRVEEIDRMMASAQERLVELQCEKDALQRRPNPLYNYTTAKFNLTAAATSTTIRKSTTESVSTLAQPNDGNNSKEEEVGQSRDNVSTSSSASTAFVEKTTREFNFPPEDLVNEYLDEIFESRRIIKMDHAYLWKCGEETDLLGDDDDDDDIDNFANDNENHFATKDGVNKLYNKDFNKVTNTAANEKKMNRKTRRRRYVNAFAGGMSSVSGSSTASGGGLWALRKTKLGVMVGETIESAGYKAVCTAVMSAMARAIGGLHGINIMSHSDIRIWIEQGDNSVADDATSNKNSTNGYAEAAVQNALAKHRSKRKMQQKQKTEQDAPFLLRDAVVETMLSNCQIAAPILKVFPLAWQRGLLGNLLTLIACVISDFADGIQLQILGHQLSFAFRPVTENDMVEIVDLIEESMSGLNSRHTRTEEFEEAVKLTADDIAASLNLLDRWHERALGGAILKEQIANLIARLVLTLVDDILCSANLNLWNKQAPKHGPHVIAGLEFRKKYINHHYSTNTTKTAATTGV